MSTEIKILHSSCCSTLSPIRAQIEKTGKENDIQVNIIELSDLQDTMSYGAMSFPSLVINGKVHDYKKIQTDEDLLSILKSQ